MSNLTFKSYARLTGLATLNKYPYTGTKGERKKVKTADQIGKVISYPYSTNDRYEGEIVKECTKDIYYKLLAQGPVALVTDAGSRTLQFYRSGVLVFKTTDCLEAKYAVTGVEYFNNPTDGEGVIVRNSWGLSWGEAGNFRVRYDAENKET